MDRRSRDHQQSERARKDVLIEDYRSILAEHALLTTVSVLLFGFLLTSSGTASTRVEEWVYAVAMVTVASSTMVFVLPVVYHHVQFPYEDFAKFQARSHRWLRFGTPILGFGLYLSLCIAIWPQLDYAAMAVAALPFAATAVFFILRRGEL